MVIRRAEGGRERGRGRERDRAASDRLDFSGWASRDRSKRQDRENRRVESSRVESSRVEFRRTRTRVWTVSAASPSPPSRISFARARFCTPQSRGLLGTHNFQFFAFPEPLNPPDPRSLAILSVSSSLRGRFASRAIRRFQDSTHSLASQPRTRYFSVSLSLSLFLSFSRRA